MRLFATASRGTEHLLAEELRLIGAESIVEARGGVAFEGGIGVAYRACLWSRVASRVLAPLAEFPAPDADALYAGVDSIDWSEHLAPTGSLAVDFVGTGGELAHTHFGALRTKDAIVDQLRDSAGARPSVDTERPDVRVNVRLHDEIATVSIDLAGEALHRRGWRAEGTTAPLKESLAAALLAIAHWPARAAQGSPFLDPMCGSGTIVIEAALAAADVAPGLLRARWGFTGWLGHDAEKWAALLEEAKARRASGLHRLPLMVGHDLDERALRAAKENARRAGLDGKVQFSRCAFADATPPSDKEGVLVMNPPYGERLGEVDALRPLYRSMGDVLKRRFPGWSAYVLTGSTALAHEIGLKPSRRHVLWNGPIECRLLELPIGKSAPVSDAGPKWRVDRREAVQMFVNRIAKNRKHLAKWAKREDVHCYRVYDADLPEYAVAVDLYEDAAHVQEYAPPATVEPEVAAGRLRDLMEVLPEALGLPADRVRLKVRRRQRAEDGEQYTRQGEPFLLTVREGGHRFRVDLGAYLDTGLFLDHRRLRAMVGELAPGKRFLNLYSYTGTATVYAAGAGAKSSTSVDLSNTYLQWAEQNFLLNSVAVRQHVQVRSDVMAFLDETRDTWDLALVAPPTFSNSKRMEGTFDVQRDHVDLLRGVARHLSPGGVILFSNHSRRFKIDREGLAGLRVEELTHATIPLDFANNRKIHNSWKLTKV